MRFEEAFVPDPEAPRSLLEGAARRGRPSALPTEVTIWQIISMHPD